MPLRDSKIQIGDLVRVREKYIFENQDVLLLPYDRHSVGLVIKIETGGYLYDSDVDISSIFGYYITVKWMGTDTTKCDSEYVHLEDELQLVAKAGVIG